jgi:glycerophosphoryl diester phosphodiesterase
MENALEAALRLHALAPEMLISHSADEAGDIAAATAAGLPVDRIIAFTGTRMVRPDLYAELEKLDIEVIFGTLGRSDDAFDVLIARYGLDARYAELGQIGVDILATDRPREAAKALADAKRLPQAGQCGVKKGG